MEPSASSSRGQAGPAAEGALLALGLLTLLRAVLLAGSDQDLPKLPGEVVDVRPEALQGDGFRLLPGVGPTLAGRLEQARVEAGGVLTEGDLLAVPGVGPGLLGRWRSLWALAEGSGVR